MILSLLLAKKNANLFPCSIIFFELFSRNYNCKVSSSIRMLKRYCFDSMFILTSDREYDENPIITSRTMTLSIERRQVYCINLNIYYNTIQLDIIRYDTMRYDVIRYYTMWYYTIRYDTIRYYIIRYIFIILYFHGDWCLWRHSSLFVFLQGIMFFSQIKRCLICETEQISFPITTKSSCILRNIEAETLEE